LLKKLTGYLSEPIIFPDKIIVVVSKPPVFLGNFVVLVRRTVSLANHST
jgi:hypothetical protein